MSNILSSLSKTVISGFILLTLIIFLISGITEFYFDYTFFTFLLWYFNFVQIPSMPNIPDDQKPAVSKFIAPKALFWFRWAALATLITGLILAYLNGYLHDAMLLNTYDAKYFMIGVGMWLGLIMAFNVWVIIWPNQKKALGIVSVDAGEKASAAKKAMLFSRTNTLLSIPMLYCMVGAQNLY